MKCWCETMSNYTCFSCGNKGSYMTLKEEDKLLIKVRDEYAMSDPAPGEIKIIAKKMLIVEQEIRRRGIESDIVHHF